MSTKISDPLYRQRPLWLAPVPGAGERLLARPTGSVAHTRAAPSLGWLCQRPPDRPSAYPAPDIPYIPERPARASTGVLVAVQKVSSFNLSIW